MFDLFVPINTSETIMTFESLLASTEEAKMIMKPVKRS